MSPTWESEREAHDRGMVSGVLWGWSTAASLAWLIWYVSP